MSGYCNCACRDCFEITISSAGAPALCHECKAAGCEIFPPDADPEARTVTVHEEDGAPVEVPSSMFNCAVERCPGCDCEVSSCDCESPAPIE